ncbi:hypothetical protein F5050DRAFT_1804793 [Lentinula boryana]|uniref:Uncharacterized protein n=1 Tax=Lentinula boryana TaxID=40481 RepID=A0ABQ8QMQ5_9AGAR|nr:hypothetical protein F5050DRAFT_1804793 [Lentinula boryana]
MSEFHVASRESETRTRCTGPRDTPVKDNLSEYIRQQRPVSLLHPEPRSFKPFPQAPSSSQRSKPAPVAYRFFLQTIAISQVSLKLNMLSIARVLVAFHTAAYLALVGFGPFTNIALATPFPTSTMKNYSASFPEEAGPRSKTLKTPSNHNSSHSSPVPRRLLPFFMRSVESRQNIDLITALNGYVSDAGVQAKNLQQCSTSCSGNPQAQQDASVSSFSLFGDSLLGFQHTVSDKGLANFDKNSGLEVLIRKLIDETKYTLNYTNDLVQCDPLLSPLLGPTVYELKCFLEWLLDITEDATDALLNDLAPTVRALVGQCGDCLLDTCLL